MHFDEKHVFNWVSQSELVSKNLLEAENIALNGIRTRTLSIPDHKQIT